MPQNQISPFALKPARTSNEAIQAADVNVGKLMKIPEVVSM